MRVLVKTALIVLFALMVCIVIGYLIGVVIGRDLGKQSMLEQTVYNVTCTLECLERCKAESNQG